MAVSVIRRLNIYILFLIGCFFGFSFGRYKFVDKSLIGFPSQSSGYPHSQALLATDDHLDTCSETMAPNSPMKSWWRVHFVEKINVHQVLIEGGVGQRVNIMVGDERCGGGAIEHNWTITCERPLTGQWLQIESEQGQLKLCNVRPMICADHFYGTACAHVCSCRNNEVCDGMTGKCPSLCDAGWKGASCNVSCSQILREFGPSCKGRCHCQGDWICDKKSGKCTGGKCSDGWFGKRCQTQIPAGEEMTVRAVSKNGSNIILGWRRWAGPWDELDKESLDIAYEVQQCRKCSSQKANATDWITLTSIVESYDSSRPIAVELVYNAQNLTLNFSYRFRIVPYLLSSNGSLRETQRNKLGIGQLLRSACGVPTAPTFVAVAECDTLPSNRPPSATLCVSWSPSEASNCLGIKWYEVQYRTGPTYEWLYILAANTARQRNITGLKFGVPYQVRVVSVNNEDLRNQSEIAAITTPRVYQLLGIPKDVAMWSGLFIACLLAFVLVLAAFLWQKHRSKSNAELPVQVEEEAGRTLLEKPIDQQSRDSGVDEGTPSEITPSTLPLESAAAPLLPYVPDFRQSDKLEITIAELKTYVTANSLDDFAGFHSEYDQVPVGLQGQCEIGKNAGNKHKNRFINIIAYDHSRVVLDCIEEDPDSDYLNANYIDGYRKPNAYIAAQGCNKYTIQDIWRLVWQTGSLRIIMVTNLVENGKAKCEQYWPDEGSKLYGTIEVMLTSLEETAHFVTRNFTLSKDGVSRDIKQFHFTSWPDHGVPKQPTPIVAFRRKINRHETPGEGPLVIHCSAGVGRTGTYIAIDYLLQQAEREGVVDVFSIIFQMRRQRVNMIQTFEQYVFVYRALLEALQSGNTCMQCADFRDTYQHLKTFDEQSGMCLLESQFNMLQLMSTGCDSDSFKSGKKPENVGKSRFPEILPLDNHRPYLMTRVEGTNDYINAVYLHSYLKKNSIILTQTPLPHTVIDLWRMVYEHHCCSIIMLDAITESDETYGQYWLDDESSECGPFVIDPISVDCSSGMTVRRMKLVFEVSSNSNPVERDIEQFHLSEWSDVAQLPSADLALRLVNLVQKHQRRTGNGPILVHCNDGADKSGIIAAMFTVWEEMQMAQEVDIFNAVKLLRVHRPQLVQTYHQYDFLHCMVLAFLQQFEIYANFR